MTWAVRLEAAKTEIAQRRLVATHALKQGETIGQTWWPHGWDDANGMGYATAKHITINGPAHVLAVLDLHEQLLALCDSAFLLPRLDRPSPMTDLVRAVLDLYNPVRENADA